MIGLEDLAQYGVYAFIPLLVGVIIYLNAQSKELQQDVKDIQAKYDSLLIQRGDENKEALLALSGPIERVLNITEIREDVQRTTNRRGR
jgi:ElaB/YqjD/DUF883 family membrane-anchored ribosome-binding protein